MNAEHIGILLACERVGVKPSTKKNGRPIKQDGTPEQMRRRQQQRASYERRKRGERLRMPRASTTLQRRAFATAAALINAMDLEQFYGDVSDHTEQEAELFDSAKVEVVKHLERQAGISRDV